MGHDQAAVTSNQLNETDSNGKRSSATQFTEEDVRWMGRALQLATKGAGRVEPNPMVGCVIVSHGRLVAEGWHERFGQPHAEINALRSATEPLDQATIYVTLEPCAHYGKTPPCVEALLAAHPQRIVVAHLDPNPLVAGKGIAQLKTAGLRVDVGLLQDEAAAVLAPFLKRMQTGFPWMIAKWAMTLDGKIATSSGDSQWISNELSRQIVHQIRGRMDGIMVGINTAVYDNPLLTARPEGERVATRIILDSRARIPLESQLCQTAGQIPTLIAVGPSADLQKIRQLEQCGCEIWASSLDDPQLRLRELLQELGGRGMTNILVEGGGQILGSLFDLQQIDEIHVFLAGKLLGGISAISPIGGQGVQKIADAQNFQLDSIRQLDHDVYIVGKRAKPLVNIEDGST